MMKKLLLPVLIIAISAIMYGQTPIDLRESDDPWSLSDAIGSASGPIDVILNSEVIYEIGSRRILQSMKIRTDPDADSPAVISINNNFWLGEVDLDSIIFDNVHIMGNGNYGFNNGNPFTLNELTFRNCIIENVSGVWRAKSDTSYLTNYTIDNCVIDTLGEYTLLRAESSNIVENISITNSTINSAKAILRISTSPESINLSDLTINEGNDAEHWLNAMFIFYETFGEMEITNVLIGPGTGGEIGGMECPDPGIISVTNSYHTSDYAEHPDMPIPDLMAYEGLSTELWADPSTGDFTIIDNGFDAKFSTGDPRWIPGQLVDIIISPGSLNPEFDPGVLSYSCELPWGTEAVIVSATPKFDDATVTGTGVVDVSSGSATANIRVQDGTISQSYTIDFTLPVGISNINTEVKMYFDPAQKIVVVDNSQAREKLQKLDIYSLSGKLIKNIPVQNRQDLIQISTETLQPGSYFIRGYYSDNTFIYLKFIR